MAYVHVDDDEVLSDLSTEQLLAELARRHSQPPGADIKHAIDVLRGQHCPVELLAPVEQWSKGKLNLADLLATRT